MKKLFLLLTLLLSFSVQSQIPNSSFEEWEDVIFYDPFGNSVTYEKPLDWETNQKFGFERLQKSIDSQDGDYSLKLLYSLGSQWDGCHSLASTSIDFINPLGPNKSLFFYFKSISSNNDGEDFFRVYLNFYQNGEIIGQFEWLNYDETPEYTLIEIPLIEYSDSISVFFSGAASGNGSDGCIDISTIWIDNLSIDESILSTIDNQFDKIIILYPNPVQNILRIENNSTIEITSIKIYDVLGRLVLVEKRNLNQVDVSYLDRGVLFVDIETDQGVYTKKVIKE